MKIASQLDVKAIREEYARTHTGPGNMSVGDDRYATKVDTTDDEAEFGAALDRYKRENRRPFPTYGEVLAVLVAMGYRRVHVPHPTKA